MDGKWQSSVDAYVVDAGFRLSIHLLTLLNLPRLPLILSFFMAPADIPTSCAGDNATPLQRFVSYPFASDVAYQVPSLSLH